MCIWQQKKKKMAQVATDLALVVLLEPQAQANEAALLQRRQITKVTSDVVGVQLVCGAKVSKEQGQLVEETKHTVTLERPRGENSP